MKNSAKVIEARGRLPIQVLFRFIPSPEYYYAELLLRVLNKPIYVQEQLHI